MHVCTSEIGENGKPPSFTTISDVIGLDHDPYSAIFTFAFFSAILRDAEQDWVVYIDQWVYFTSTSKIVGAANGRNERLTSGRMIPGLWPGSPTSTGGFNYP